MKTLNKVASEGQVVDSGEPVEKVKKLVSINNIS